MDRFVPAPAVPDVPKAKKTLSPKLVDAGVNLPAPDNVSTPAAATGTAEDRYWAAQPVEVRQLRSIDDPDTRSMVAQSLSAKGYKIDLPIMVWGWGAANTMLARQSYGYTWVPSMGQPPVQVAPGLFFPGVPSYDPNAHPAGSIEVDTSFI